jgi:hypothetical protein
LNLHTVIAASLAALALIVVPTAPSHAAHRALDRHAKPKVTVTVPDSVVEGDRFVVKVKVARTKGARRILLQTLTTNVFGDKSWETVKRSKVKGKKHHSFRVIAGEDDSQRYRVRVLYADAKPAMSKSASTTVWHWVGLTRFADYYQTPGVFESATGPINGARYNGLFTYGSTYSSWEIRYTLGRHCQSLRGVLGVEDKSADGSSASISLVADEATTVLTSGVLTPGMSQPFQVDIELPYRLSVQMQETSPADQAAYPAVGDPELLCTGLQ